MLFYQTTPFEWPQSEFLKEKVFIESHLMLQLQFKHFCSNIVIIFYLNGSLKCAVRKYDGLLL